MLAAVTVTSSAASHEEMTLMNVSKAVAVEAVAVSPMVSPVMASMATGIVSPHPVVVESHMQPVSRAWRGDGDRALQRRGPMEQLLRVQDALTLQSTHDKCT